MVWPTGFFSSIILYSYFFAHFIYLAQPSGCDDVDCCGPAQKGGESWDQVNDWCESTVPYTSLILNEPSETVTFEPQETAYFRFFIPEDLYCTPFQILIRPFYGVPIFFLTNLFAIASESNALWRQGKAPPTFGWAQNTFVICPAVSDYSLGTYSLGVFGWYSTSFTVEIAVANQPHPLPPPPGRITCDQVPAQELVDAAAGSGDDVYCLNDTETLLLNYSDFPSGDYVQLVLPVPAGL